MMKNTKKIKRKLRIITTVTAIIIIALLILSAVYMPLLKLKLRLNELISDNYKFSAVCNVSGMNLPVLGDEFAGEIKGSKGDEVLYAELIYEDKSYLEIYVDEEYEMVFNFEPLLQSLFAMITDKSLLQTAFNFFVKDNYISMEQIKDVTGLDIITISDTEITSDVFKSLAGERNKNIKCSVKYLKNIADEHKILDDASMYFQVSLEGNDTGLIIGMPRSSKDKRFSLEITAENVTWKFVVEYRIMNSQGKEMPDNLVSETKIAILKKLYSYWIENVMKQ